MMRMGDVTASDMRKGSVIDFRLFGETHTTRGTVEGFGEKDGRDLVDVDTGNWCYLDQIVRVVTY